MATLNGTNPKNTYASLLKLESNNISSSYKIVEDGDGNDTGLYLKDSGVKVKSLEFENTPATASAGNINVIVNEGGVSKQAVIYTFGQSAKDIYEGHWYLQSSLSSVSVTSGTEELVRCNGATAETQYRPVDISQIYNTSTYKIGQGLDGGTGFKIVAQITITPSSGWTASTDYFDIGLDLNNDGAMDSHIQTFMCPKGASTPMTFVVTFEHYVTTPIQTNGAEIYIKPIGSDLSYEFVNLYVTRTYKR